VPPKAARPPASVAPVAVLGSNRKGLSSCIRRIMSEPVCPLIPVSRTSVIIRRQ
jgi:hypothetical protein